MLRFASVQPTTGRALGSLAFTALAGNPPINAADEDALIIVRAVPIGVVLDRLLSGFGPEVSLDARPHDHVVAP